MDRNQEIADDSIRLAGADGFLIQSDRARIDADLHWIIDRMVAEHSEGIGDMTPERGRQTERMFKGYMDATHEVELKQAARRLLTPY